MKRTRLALGATVAAVALAVSACGSGSDSSSGGDTVASKLVFGGPAQFKTRADGLPGLKKTYGVEFGKVVSTSAGGSVTVSALKAGRIQAADIFTTDPSIEANDFVALEDPKNNFAAQNIVPIIAKDKATAGTSAVINAVQAKLTTDGLRDLVTKAVTDKQDPAEVAKGFLSENGLDASGTQAAGTSITVGSADFPENVVLAQIYAQALKAQGAKVTEKFNIGERAKYFPALKDGSVDLFPEYTGSTLFYLDTKATATDSSAVFTALGEALPSNLVALDQAEAQDSDAIVVTKDTADKYNLKTIADLANKP